MRSAGKVVIRTSKYKVFLIVAGSPIFVVGGIWMLSLNTEDIEGFRRFNYPFLVRGVGAASVGFFGLCALWGARKIMDTSPGLILDSSRITDNSSAVAAGFIQWNEIQGFAEQEIHGQKMLIVFVEQPEKYMNARGILRRALNRANQNLVGSPIAISANSLKIEYSELIQVFGDFFQRHGHDA